MRAPGNLRGSIRVRIILLALLCICANPFRAVADDKTNSDPPAKPAPVKLKIDAAALGLTERERWLLDRVEQLEKRVAELESKGQPAAAAAPEASASEASVTSPAPASTTTAAPESVTPAISSSVSNDHAGVSVGPQATEKGKSGAAKAASPSRSRSRTSLG
jgi:hypothetical protein